MNFGKILWGIKGCISLPHPLHSPYDTRLVCTRCHSGFYSGTSLFEAVFLVNPLC